MASFDSHPSIIARLKELSDKLSSSFLTENELDEFERLSSELYKRAVILNYKAKEEVFKKQNPEKTKVEEKVIEEEKVEEVIEKPVVKKEHTDTFAFDFSEDFSDETPSQPEIHPKNKVVEVATPQEETKTVNTDLQNEFHQRFVKAIEAAATDKLANSKISSLKDSFGLNDRLLFINELFDGSADEFNEAVEVLDQQNNSQEAISKLSEMAIEKNWQKEAESVDDFAHLVIRRYVD